MNRAIDIYCERLGPCLWAEPLNAFTNLAFIVAGIVLVAALRRAGPAVRRDPAMLGLVLLLFVIGIGSGLFHTFAVAWAALPDVIPVALFILLYKIGRAPVRTPVTNAHLVCRHPPAKKPHSDNNPN